MESPVTLRRQTEKCAENLGKAWKSGSTEKEGFKAVCQSVSVLLKREIFYFQTKMFSLMILCGHNPGIIRIKFLFWSQGGGLKAWVPQSGKGEWGAVTLPSSLVLLALGGSHPVLTRPHFSAHLGPDPP